MLKKVCAGQPVDITAQDYNTIVDHINQSDNTPSKPTKQGKYIDCSSTHNIYTPTYMGINVDYTKSNTWLANDVSGWYGVVQAPSNASVVAYKDFEPSQCLITITDALHTHAKWYSGKLTSCSASDGVACFKIIAKPDGTGDLYCIGHFFTSTPSTQYPKTTYNVNYADFGSINATTTGSINTTINMPVTNANTYPITNGVYQFEFSTSGCAGLAMYFSKAHSCSGSISASLEVKDNNGNNLASCSLIDFECAWSWGYSGTSYYSGYTAYTPIAMSNVITQPFVVDSSTPIELGNIACSYACNMTATRAGGTSTVKHNAPSVPFGYNFWLHKLS